ncbi:MAG: ComF family protein [Halopseudomonas sp.]
MQIAKVYNWLNNDQSSHCLLCLSGDSTDHRASVQQGLCEPCRRDLPWLGTRCRQCALPLPFAGQLCGKCQQHPPAYSQVICPFLYRFPLDSLVPAFKYHNQLIYGRLLAHLLTDYVTYAYQEQQHALPDALIPMPLYRQRQAQRGFNQALELARPVARALACPLLSSALKRVQATHTQQGLTAQQRKHNLRGAFACSAPDKVAGLHLALIDDVLTTGATADEAAHTLLQAGAHSVSVWCVARTP